MKTEPCWYKKRCYKHFDRPLNSQSAISLTEDPYKVIRHNFYPFISTTIYTPRYKRHEHLRTHKPRDIAYAAHADAHIFAYYSYILSCEYEDQLKRRGISNSVIAYRKLGKKCNIHFAKEAFERIADCGDCYAMVFDVKDFFGNIDHSILKERWCQLLDVEYLRQDHFSVYKNITKYASVDRKTIYRMFHIGQRRSRQYWKPICTSAEFRSIIRNSELINGSKLIKRNMKKKGIPQGSPISAMLSNLYLLEFDTKMVEYCNSISAIYRRYSDDILLICPRQKREELREELNIQLSNVKLSLNDKEKESEFYHDSQGKLTANKPIQYLGFLFDGERILIRSQTISRYYGKMHRAVHFASVAAYEACTQGGDPRRYKRKILRVYSGMGRARNYQGYVRRSSEVMDSDAIKKQHRKSWKILNELLQKPICKEPCSICKMRELSNYTNLLGHGISVTRDKYCPYGEPPNSAVEFGSIE